MIVRSTALCPAAPRAIAGPQLPAPDANGDYRLRTLHTRWRVTDSDTKGLNGRLSPEFPPDYDHLDAKWPVSPDIDSWPVTAKFAPGTTLTAVTGNMGVIILNDAQGDPWLMVRNERATDGAFSFVRANTSYIEPCR
ncbi:MAG: hypothetical protein EB084_17845 [Proteobacteria bacterium]|nr:hypothetical protein [Pseudomonadota bacterium]